LLILQGIASSAESFECKRAVLKQTTAAIR
jgi:hypothetical protein